MRLALWTPAPVAGWARALEQALGAAHAVELLSGASAPSDAELDLYHVAADPAHGFVYRALVARPGVVLLADWGLHALVHAETAGRGDPDAYLREARHANGDTGVFVARQVLAGIGGRLGALVAMNARVLDCSLALVAASEELRERAKAPLAGRPLLQLPFEQAELDEWGAPNAEARRIAAALESLLREVLPLAERERLRIAERAAAEATPAGGALDELRWSARELGLGEPPEDARALVAALFEQST